MKIINRHIQQARTSKCCGQACLAMLAGVSLDVAVRTVGHRQGTDKRTIIRAAKKLGLKPKTLLWVLAKDRDTLPENAIVVTRRKRRRNWHWCCFVDHTYHDPSMPRADMVGRNNEIICWMEFEKGNKRNEQ